MSCRYVLKGARAGGAPGAQDLIFRLQVFVHPGGVRSTLAQFASTQARFAPPGHVSHLLGTFRFTLARFASPWHVSLHPGTLRFTVGHCASLGHVSLHPGTIRFALARFASPWHVSLCPCTLRFARTRFASLGHVSLHPGTFRGGIVILVLELFVLEFFSCWNDPRAGSSRGIILGLELFSDWNYSRAGIIFVFSCWICFLWQIWGAVFCQTYLLGTLWLGHGCAGLCMDIGYFVFGCDIFRRCGVWHLAKHVRLVVGFVL